MVDVDRPEHKGFRQALLDIYVPRYGSSWESVLDSATIYAHIEAAKMFTFDGSSLR